MALGAQDESVSSPKVPRPGTPFRLAAAGSAGREEGKPPVVSPVDGAEEDKHSPIQSKKGDEPFPKFVLIRRPIKEPKVRCEYKLLPIQQHMKSFNCVVAIECAEPDVNRTRTVIKVWND